MSIACVLNTSCLAPNANDLLSSGKVPYGRRAWLLRNVILPVYRWAGLFSEIVIVGEFEKGEGYTWIPGDSIYQNCADALWKRQVGFDALRHKSVEWVLFQHDDHLYGPTNEYPAGHRIPEDVISPSRWTRARIGSGEPLNDGSHLGHINGHACLMRPGVFRAGFSWAEIPPVFTWDVEASKRLAELKLTHAHVAKLKVWDLEEGSTPWA